MRSNDSEKLEARDFFCRVRDSFRHFARKSSEVLGSAWAFIGAIFIIVVWGLTGPTFHFSDTWQLIINTGTTIVTFLMVFLIQNTQNRDAKATQLKLDELIHAIGKARNRVIGVESEPEERIEHEIRELEAEKDKPSAPSQDERTRRPPRNGRSHDGEPAGHR